MIKEYEVGVKYTVEHLTGYKIFAASEQDAVEIAKRMFNKSHKELCVFHSAKVIKL